MQRLLFSRLLLRNIPQQALFYPRVPPRNTVVPVAEDASGSTVDGLTFDTAALDFRQGEPLVIAIASSQAGVSGQTPASVIADPGGTNIAFTQVGTALDITASPARRISVWQLTPTTTFSAAVRITFVTTNQTSCVWLPIHCVGAVAIQQVTTPATATSVNAAANALATFENPNNVCLAFFLTASATAAPANGETELAEQAQASTTLNLQGEYKVNHLTATATLSSSVVYGAISLELKAG